MRLLWVSLKVSWPDNLAVLPSPPNENFPRPIWNRGTGSSLPGCRVQSPACLVPESRPPRHCSTGLLPAAICPRLRNSLLVQDLADQLGEKTTQRHLPSSPLKYLHQCDQDACCTDSGFISALTCFLANCSCSSASAEESIWMKAALPLNTLFGNSLVIPLDSDWKAVRKGRGA